MPSRMPSKVVQLEELQTFQLGIMLIQMITQRSDKAFIESTINF